VAKANSETGSSTPTDTRCAYNDYGQRCPNIGTLSPSTNGSGLWYCRDHAHVFLHDAPHKSDGHTWRKLSVDVKSILGRREPGEEG
jgi:hypothetical protein